MAIPIGTTLYPFYAEITFGYHENDIWVEKQKSIITFAENFCRAMANIEHYYGEELLSIEKLIAYEAGDIIEVSLDVGRSIKKEMEDY